MHLKELLESQLSSVEHLCSEERLPPRFLYTETIASVLAQLSENGAITGLVYCGSTTCKSDGPVLIRDILGFIDLSIILQAALRRIFEGNELHHEQEQLNNIISRFCNEEVGSLLDDGGAAYHGTLQKDWALKGDESASLQSIIRQCFLFTKPGSIMRPPKSPAKSIHHVALYSVGNEAEAAELRGILSQHDLIRILHNSAVKEGTQGSGIFNKTVVELGLVQYCSIDVPPSPSTTSSETSDMHCMNVSGSKMTLVPAWTTTLEAFRRMCMHRGSGVGVLGSDGTVRHHLCPKDLRCLTACTFDNLLMPVDAFLEKKPLLKASNQNGSSEELTEEQKAKCPHTVRCTGVVTCQATSTLAEVLSIMAARGTHQVFVVDPDTKPLSTLTIVDLLRVIVDSVAKAGTKKRKIIPSDPPMQCSIPLESATSCQSDKGVSACTSELSIPQESTVSKKVPLLARQPSSNVQTNQGT